MTSPAELADRVEGLEGPCREVDEAIHAAMRLTMVHELVPGEVPRWIGPAYTASLDAAETLVPENCKQCWAAGWGVDGRAFATIGFERSRYAATPALALCAAALRAMEPCGIM